MWDWKKWTELFVGSLQDSVSKFMSVLPNVLGAILVLVLGWLLARLIAAGLKRILQGAKFDNLSERMKIKETLEKGNIKQEPSVIVSKFVYWVLLLLVFTTSSDILGWTAVSEEISKLIGYLPTLFSAIILFLLGAFIAGFVRDVIRGATASLGISAGRIMSQVIYYLLFIIITLTALRQAGIDTTIITSNLLIIVGTVLGTAAISYGFASRDILSNVLAGYFGKRMYQIGQNIEIDGVRGTIVNITSIAITIQTTNEKVVIPTQDFIKNKVKIFDKEESVD